MQFQPRSTRFVALFTAVALASATLFHPAPARADKAKSLKYGAIALGVVGAYMLSKGKTVPGAAAVAGGVYAYKKSRDAKDNRNNDRTARYPDNGGYSNGGYSNGSYSNYPDYNGSYSNGSYPYNNGVEYQANASQTPRQQCQDQRPEQRQDRRQDRRGNRSSNYDVSPYRR